VLELGCGAGRVTRHLVARGHPVTGVDNSEAMLEEFARLEGTEAVLADIASLDLGRTWPAVVLASHMINDVEGSAFLLAAARHLSDDGVLLVQRYEPGWVDAAEPTVAEHHRVVFELTDVDHRGSGVVSATAAYTVDGTVYRQAFIAYEVNDERLEAMVASAGVELFGYLDHDRTWVKLVRTTSRTAVP
jgi:SAM-dependent methyltransferase